MFWKRITVANHERVVLVKNGRFRSILTPGEYRIFTLPGVSLEIERHYIHRLVFQSRWADYLLAERPEIAERYFVRVETNHVQVALIYIDGKLHSVLTPARRLLFWRGSFEIKAEMVEVIAEPELSSSEIDALESMTGLSI